VLFSGQITYHVTSCYTGTDRPAVTRQTGVVLQLQVWSGGTAEAVEQLNCDKLTLAFNDLNSCWRHFFVQVLRSRCIVT